MFSPVQAIIAAEAGVKARAENMAAVIKILISISLENSQHIAGRRNTLSPPTAFPREEIFVRCNATEPRFGS
jgi:hypothetical protein